MDIYITIIKNLNKPLINYLDNFFFRKHIAQLKNFKQIMKNVYNMIEVLKKIINVINSYNTTERLL